MKSIKLLFSIFLFTWLPIFMVGQYPNVIENRVKGDSIESLIKNGRFDRYIIGPWNESLSQRKNCSNGIIVIASIDPMSSAKAIRKKVRLMKKIKAYAIHSGMDEAKIFLELRSQKQTAISENETIIIRRAFLWKVKDQNQLIN